MTWVMSLSKQGNTEWAGLQCVLPSPPLPHKHPKFQHLYIYTSPNCNLAVMYQRKHKAARHQNGPAGQWRCQKTRYVQSHSLLLYKGPGKVMCGVYFLLGHVIRIDWKSGCEASIKPSFLSFFGKLEWSGGRISALFAPHHRCVSLLVTCQ